MQWSVVLTVALLGWMFTEAFLPMTAKQGTQMRGVLNCKQVILSLKQYAKDNGSAYPDTALAGGGAKSANQVFRRLFQEEILTAAHEGIFGCTQSVFVPDGDIGMAPDFAKALEPGECHWMMMRGQTDASMGDMPIVMENALNVSWPPRWDISDQAGHKRGRAWKGGRIIIGRNDGSVAVEKLSPDGTMDWRCMYNTGYGNESWINTLTPEQTARLSCWDIEDK